MTAQSTDAAQRSAHVTRGPAAQDSASVVREWREDGKLVACAEGVALLREELEEARAENARLRACLASIVDDDWHMVTLKKPGPWAHRASLALAGREPEHMGDILAREPTP
ncbi:hypothetical protein [Roseococcus pinisoli]|uniref:Uncharacterized protein n=1 Tax=Roseococcus pinisoli TaxID=2835040 RepID=A0ABS5QBX7_9PROT|nr:hypothetical protein [Roseococcus pinisoli]MBS7811197.1 hypothetical protein [Roseococcus pinisoli]